VKGFYLTAEGEVEEKWIDINGHMNIAHYVALFDKGTFAMLKKIGIDSASLKENLPTVVASRIYVAHRKELLLGDRWELWSGFASISKETLTISHRLISNSSSRAVCDIKGEVISPVTRGKSNLSDETVELAQSYLVKGLRDRFAVVGQL